MTVIPSSVSAFVPENMVAVLRRLIPLEINYLKLVSAFFFSAVQGWRGVNVAHT